MIRELKKNNAKKENEKLTVYGGQFLHRLS
jgi:hypothetical protein